jgi:hypothetical protein
VAQEELAARAVLVPVDRAARVAAVEPPARVEPAALVDLGSTEDEGHPTLRPDEGCRDPGGFANDAILGTMPRGSAVVEQGRLILIVSVERNGLLDERASKRLLRELLVAASGEEPFAVVRAPAGTWVAPSLVDVPPDSKRIAPELIVDLVKALHALGYRDAREISHSTGRPQSTQPHSEVSARVGVCDSDRGRWSGQETFRFSSSR